MDIKVAHYFRRYAVDFSSLYQLSNSYYYINYVSAEEKGRVIARTILNPRDINLESSFRVLRETLQDSMIGQLGAMVRYVREHSSD